MRLRKAQLLSAIFQVTVLTLIPVSVVFAQNGSEPPKPSLIVVSAINVKPHLTGEFEELFKGKIMPAFKKGGAPTISMWRTAFGDPMRYYLVVSLPSFAALDGPSPLVRGLGEETPTVLKGFSSLIDGVESKIFVERPDLSHFGKLEGDPGIAALVEISVSYRKDEAFEKFMEQEYLPAIAKSDVPGIWTSKLVFGGSVGKYALVVVEKNFAGLEKGPPIRRALDAEQEARMFEKLPSGTIKDLSVTLIRYMPALSYGATDQ